MASSASADGTLSMHTNASTAIEEDEELETSDMEKAIMLACEEAWKAAGGAHKYLCQQYDSPESRQAFTDLLVKNLPFLDGVCYHTNGIPPSVQEHEVCQKPAMMLHPAMLSWSENSSIKAEPEINQCLRLAREFLKDGFLTAPDPLLIQVGESMDPGMWQQWKWGNDGSTEGAILPQSIGYLMCGCVCLCAVRLLSG